MRILVDCGLLALCSWISGGPAFTTRLLAAKVWCAKSHVSCGEEAMSPKGLPAYPTRWWDNRRSKPTPRHPDAPHKKFKVNHRPRNRHKPAWMDARLATLDAGMKTPSRHPDFRHNKSKVGLWLNNGHKPTWVDSQLVTNDPGIKGPPESVSTPIKGQRAFGRLGAHEGHWDVGMCRKICEDGRITEAVDALNFLVQRGFHVDKNLFYRVLKRCMGHKDLGLCRRIHVLTINSGYEGDAFLATHLIGLYASHGRLKEAIGVFSKVSTPSSYNWATIIFAYARHGEAAEAIRLYRKMRESSTVKPTDHILVAVLKACAAARDLVSGKEIHAHILASPGKPNNFVETGLVNMYAKCGRVEDARSIFAGLPDKNVVTWTALIAGYAQQGMGEEALSLYTSMQQEGITPPDSVAFVCLLQACASIGETARPQGKQLHAQIEERRLQDDVVVGGSLVNMYVKCCSVEDARSIFDRLPAKNVVTWNAMLAGYVQQGMGQEALSLYSCMQQEGLTPDSVAFVCLLRACASVGIGAVVQGMQLHAHIEERGLQDDVVVGGSLVNMYAKCGRLEDARNVFDRLPLRNVVIWTTMIAAYVQQGMGQEALSLYSSMQQEGITIPNSITFVCLLQACANVGVGALQHGKQLHAQIEEQGLQADVVVGGSLVNMYVKCDSLEDARSMFDRIPEKNVVTWTAMIAGYAEQGMGQGALNLYNSMLQEGIAPPNSVTFACLLQACSSVGVGALHQGKQLHAQIQDQGFQADVVLGTCLVDMYVKCGSLEDARSMFDRFPDRDVVTWNVMLAGYVQHGMGQEALTLYTSMQQEGITAPNSVTFVCLLQACAIVAALPLGEQLHAQIGERGLQSDVVVGSALVNMYAKCGSMVHSQQVFDSLPKRPVEAWGALTGGYARQGDCERVFALLDRMSLEGTEPNGITFLNLLTVCSHVGLVNKGRKYFDAMRREYGICPTVEHFTCMMDLLGRAGLLDEALQMAKSMPFPPDGAVWLTLLGACRKWNNVEIGQQAFQFAVSVDGKDAASYVLMSNIYASAGMWEAAKEVQVKRVRSGAWKKPGQSWWTDAGGVVHTFVVGDKKHQESEGISARLEQLVPQMKKEGYVPHLDSSLREISDDEKEADLCVGIVTNWQLHMP